jgi:hypothetical protein
MKALLAITLISVLNALFPGDVAQVGELKTAIDEADFVGFVVKPASSSSQEKPRLIVAEVFKGNADVFYHMQTEIKLDDWDYLLVAKTNRGEITEVLYPVILTARLSKAEMKTLDDLPCYDESLKAQYQNGACHRTYIPVCGCDLKTYSNVCELKKNGVIKYRKGRCK